MLCSQSPVICPTILSAEAGPGGAQLIAHPPSTSVLEVAHCFPSQCLVSGDTDSFAKSLTAMWLPESPHMVSAPPALLASQGCMQP
jgi:hypothetical protein